MRSPFGEQALKACNMFSTSGKKHIISITFKSPDHSDEEDRSILIGHS